MMVSITAIMGNVRIAQLEKVYFGKSRSKDFRAVKSIDLEVEDGEFMVLVGPSGCGKSTTLRMIAGLEDVTGGTITIDDTVINHLEPKERDIAMVFQNYALYPHMTVFQNMAFALTLSKVSKDEIAQRVKASAKILGLEGLLERKPQALSGGQRQRVAVGRAIVRNPKVFLFDEPLSNLDAKMRASMRVELMKLHSHLSSTMIYVTHDQVEAMTMGDRICVMREGDIMQVDTPSGIYERPSNRFVASFMGSPPMNFFSGELEAVGNEVVYRLSGGEEITINPGAFSLGGGESELGIRPEDMSIVEEGTDSASFVAKIELIETLGGETLYHVAFGFGRAIVREQGGAKYRLMDSVSVRIDRSKLHLFDLNSGASLRLCK